MHKYEAYKKSGHSFEKVKEIELDDYCGAIMDLSGGSAAIDATIAQSGPRFARELSEKLGKEITTNDVSILMKYAKDALPQAVLMTGTEKHRSINIEQEFLQGQ